MVTMELPNPSITASALHRITDVEALALVEHLLGDASQWPSPLINYRFTSEWQADWKAELGHWLHTAGTLGFQGQLVARVLGRARRGSRSTTVDPNDQRHLDLQSEMAPAMVAHYLVGTGWTYRQWEAVTGGTGDVDVEFVAPGGVIINTQVKAPDQPGGRAGGCVVDGEYDDRVLTALRNAANQLLPFGASTNVIVICARRSRPLSHEPEPLVGYLYGATRCDRTGRVWLPHPARGWFFTQWWRHIGAVVVLDYVRGVGDPTYGCVVLVNPMAQHGVVRHWFPHAHACFLEGDVFRWQNGEPGGYGYTALPEGTFLEP